MMNKIELNEQLIEWRHYLHRHPESAFEEVETAKFLAEKLKEMGFDVTEKIGGTGLVATLKDGDGGKVIGIRSDMDCLRINERGENDHVSMTPDRMHACGHDGHMTTLLGAAKILSDERDFDGTVRLIFQPAEEPGKGARAMLDDGLFDKFPVDEIYAMHNAPFIKAGKAATRAGGIASSEDDFTIKITGKGGHASSPHEGVDPLACFAEMYLAFQTIVSRNARPSHAVVISCTEVLTDGAHNAIPGYVEVRGDARSYSPEDQEMIESRMRSIATHVCEMNGASCEFEYTHEFSPVVNDPDCTSKAARTAERCFGKDNVEADCEPWTVSEDFSEYLKYVPGCLILLGSGKNDSGNTSLHDNRFDYNDDVLLSGAEFWAALIRDLTK
jgi:hippurate hydrolase